MKSAVITGATGMMGVSLASLLLSKGYRVHAIVHSSSNRKTTLPSHKQLLVHEVDMSDLEILPILVSSSCSLFFHLAWCGSAESERNNPALQCSNIEYALRAIEAAHELGCEVFVGAGSQAEYGQCDDRLQPHTPTFPQNAYGHAKLCAGQLTRLRAQQLNVRHEWARILSVYGPGDAPGTLMSYLIGMLLRGETPLLTACEQLWDYLYVDDAARALLGMAEKGRTGATYVVGSGKTRPLTHFVEVIKNKIDPDALLSYGAIPYSSGQIKHLCADISAMERDFGFKPQVTFDEGVERTIRWMRNKQGGNT